MKPILLLPVFLFFVLLAGCGEPKADISTPKTHQTGAIFFHYPKNWRVTEELVTQEIHNIFVESSGGALVILQLYPTDGAYDLIAFSKDFSESAASAAIEAPIGMMETSKFTDLPVAADYSWIVEDFEIKLLGESIPHKRFYGTKDIGGRQVFLIFQVATEDYSMVESGFHLIRNSLRSTQTAEQEAVTTP